MTEPRVTERLAAVLAGHRADEDAARAALRSTDGDVRASALVALHRMGRLGADDLRRGLADESVPVRYQSARLAAGHADVDLIPVLGDDDLYVAEMAAWAIGERAETTGEERAALIARATGDERPLVREASVAALGAIGHPDGLAAILAGCDDKPAIRRRAVLALAPFEGPAVEAALRAALDDRDWQVRQNAEDLLQQR